MFMIFCFYGFRSLIVLLMEVKCMISAQLYLPWNLMISTDYGVTSYDIGTGFGHFAIATPDVSF